MIARKDLMDRKRPKFARSRRRWKCSATTGLCSWRCLIAQRRPPVPASKHREIST